MTRIAHQKSKIKTRTLASLLDANIPERKPLLGSWLTERHLNMVFAAAGVGKSMFTMSAALAISGGGAYLGWKAPEARPVLIVDAEMDVADLKERAAMLMASVPELDQDAAGRNLWFMARQDQAPGVAFPDLATPEGHKEVLKAAEECGAALVVLDNFSTLANVEDENAASSFNPIIDLMQNLKLANRAVVLVHHARKGNGGGQSYRGTSKMEVVFNSMLELRHPDGIPSRDGTAFDLHWAKFRGLRDDNIRPLRVRLKASADDDNASRWEHDVNDHERLGELVAMVKTVDYSTQADLAKAMGISTGLLSKLKTKAMAGGLISDFDWNRCMKQARNLVDGFEDDEGEDY